MASRSKLTLEPLTPKTSAMEHETPEEKIEPQAVTESQSKTTAERNPRQKKTSSPSKSFLQQAVVVGLSIASVLILKRKLF